MSSINTFANVLTFLFVLLPVALLHALSSRLLRGALTLRQLADPEGPPNNDLALAQAMSWRLPTDVSGMPAWFKRSAIPRHADGRWSRRQDVYQAMELHYECLRDNVSQAFADSAYVHFLTSFDAVVSDRHILRARDLWGDPELYGFRILRPAHDCRIKPVKQLRREVAENAQTIAEQVLAYVSSFGDDYNPLTDPTGGYLQREEYGGWPRPFLNADESLLLQDDEPATADEEVARECA